ncbi:MAG: OmpA family protein [Polyangia bacterium]
MRKLLPAIALLWTTAVSASASAQTAGPGFQVNRYEPTAAGEWSLLVEHPWYSSTRYFAAGVTLNYAHNPLTYGLRFADGSFVRGGAVIGNQLIGHIDVAGSFLDRVLLSLSMPLTMYESGESQYGVSPASGAAVGDPRIGARVRLFGQPYQGPASLSLGVDVWIPINTFASPPPFPAQTGESGVRALPKLIAGGLWKSLMWSLTAGFYWRPNASLSKLQPVNSNSIGAEVQFGAAVAYANRSLGLAVGPEVLVSSVVAADSAGGSRAFKPDSMGIELLLGAHYSLAKTMQISLGGGTTFFQVPGAPDFRFLTRLAYAPFRDAKAPDADGDGIPDHSDACPSEAGVASKDPKKHGCPLPNDRDRDGVIDPDDLCVDVPAGKNPDPERRGCPLGDKDGDGVLDPQDLCPTEAAGKVPDPKRLGCPAGDADSDGVLDPEDLCPSEPVGKVPDPNRKGCPDKDSDGDGVFDSQDQCKDVHAGLMPDPMKAGCPSPDRDGDSIADPVDACPDKKGAPSADPKKNGCPGLVVVESGQIVILKQVFFATGKDTILKVSYPVLDAVVMALKAFPDIKRVRVEGHTDNQGKADYNTSLSDRRAKSVMAYLIVKGIEARRLDSQGFGPSKPIADNKTVKGRALNRRVDFVIVEPNLPMAKAPLPPPPVQDEAKPKAPVGKAPVKAPVGKAPVKPAAKAPVGKAPAKPAAK